MALIEEEQEEKVDQEKISKLRDPGFISSNSEDTERKSSAKANLHELCTKARWKKPEFECCNEEGLDHQKLFTFKVLVRVREESTTLECYGNPRANKKAAANDAAEGAPWCLKHMGYELKKQQKSQNISGFNIYRK
ncbi:ribonuclease 3-like protein 1 [Striga asiatica]|uniref:Ribonuclease 3-like protein 1 n=1 Tax=Striga asiatica TaxID=4170 RepID=A0A5A7QU98_STRAF|nr:ribonuclease 3-like protein 1 [Striga asiatica]